MRYDNAPIGYNIVFSRNTIRIDIVNNEITPFINSTTVQLTNEQHVLLSNLKMLLALRNGVAILSYLSSYDIQCLITYLATL